MATTFSRTSLARVCTGSKHLGEERWRWTAGPRCFYVPIPENQEPGGGVSPAVPELELNGEPTPLRRVVDLVNSAGAYLRRDGYAGDCGADLPDDERWSLPRECFAAPGTALVTTASVLERVGPLEGGFFAYYEDTDWCWRARLQGYRIMYEPAPTLRHVRGQTSGGTLAARTRFLAERNRILTLARCGPLPLAFGEARRKWSGGGDDGVAGVLPPRLPRSFGTACAPAAPLGIAQPGGLPPLGGSGPSRRAGGLYGALKTVMGSEWAAPGTWP